MFNSESPHSQRRKELVVGFLVPSVKLFQAFLSDQCQHIAGSYVPLVEHSGGLYVNQIFKKEFITKDVIVIILISCF